MVETENKGMPEEKEERLLVRIKGRDLRKPDLKRQGKFFHAKNRTEISQREN